MYKQAEFNIMKFFVSRITKRYSLNAVAKEMDRQQSVIWRSSRKLIEKKLITPDDNGLYTLNYKENHIDLVNFEYQRSSDFLSMPKNKDLARFVKEVVKTLDRDKFILLLFGSAVEKPKPKDYDILLLIDAPNKEIDNYEAVLYNLAENYTSIEIETKVDSFRGFKEMLKRRDKNNVVNEALNKHMLFYGADLFYRILSRERLYDA